MNWTELKAYIDKLLDDAEISHDTEIWFVDIAWPVVGDITVALDSKTGELKVIG